VWQVLGGVGKGVVGVAGGVQGGSVLQLLLVVVGVMNVVVLWQMMQVQREVLLLLQQGR
jgi:hypothetical protein